MSDDRPLGAGVPTERRRELCQERVTLDGQPATISGYRQPYATVRILTGAQYGHQWSWEAVERIVAKGGEFHS